MSQTDESESSIPKHDAERVDVRYTRPRRAASSFAEEVKRRHETHLLSFDGVEGVGVSASNEGDAIVLYLADDVVTSQLPVELEGVAVQRHYTGKIRPV